MADIYQNNVFSTVRIQATPSDSTYKVLKQLRENSSLPTLVACIRGHKKSNKLWALIRFLEFLYETLGGIRKKIQLGALVESFVRSLLLEERGYKFA